MNKTITTIVVAALLAFTMIGVRHIDKLNDGIELKQIQLQDNSAKLKILDKKYQDLNKQLDQTGADKAKVEQQLQELQNERDSLQQQLQAKLQAKQSSIAYRAQNALVGTASASACGSDPYMAQIYMHESNCSTTAINSIGCRGIGQRCGNLPCGDDFACQDAWFRQYAMSRYGSFAAAWSFWQQNHWW